MSKTAIERVIETAKGEIGYLEKETNSRLDNKTANAGDENWNKYARDLDALGVVYNGRKNGYAWCDIFVDWCFIHTFGLDAAMEMLNQDYKGLGAGCTYSANYFKNAGRFHESPQPGDQIFFTKDRGKTSYHTGLVVDVRGGRVYTVEGNTSSLPGVVENGGCVRNKDYPIGASYIGGYGRPDYSIVGKDELDMTKDELLSCAGTGDNPSDWAKEGTEFCKEHGIFGGDGNGNYGWQQPITREAVACVIQRVLEAAKEM